MARRAISPVQDERPELLVTLGVLCWLGCAALVAGTAIGPFFVPDYNWVSDTISDLAAGEGEIVMDLALYGYAAGLIAAALAAAHLHLGRWGWSVGVFSLAILAATVVVVAARNEYGDADNEGVVIHVYLTYILGVFFTLGPLGMSGGIARLSRSLAWTFRIMALAWAVCGAAFYFMPTDIDGVWERGLGLLTFAWLLPLGYVFIRRGREGRGAIADG